MLEISLNVYYTIAIAILVLMLGDFIKRHVSVLRKFCIPHLWWAVCCLPLPLLC